MNCIRFVLKFLACIMVLSFLGCGSKDVNGSLTVVASSPVTSTSTSKVSFTVSYSNPQKADVIGTEIFVIATLNGATIATDSFTYSTNNSGVQTFTYTVDRAAAEQTLSLRAQTGSLVASDSAVITGLGQLAASPSPVNLTVINSHIIVTITGGLPPYTVALELPNSNITISPTVTSGTFTVQTSAITGTGTASIIVSDSVSPNPDSLRIPVTY